MDSITGILAKFQCPKGASCADEFCAFNHQGVGLDLKEQEQKRAKEREEEKHRQLEKEKAQRRQQEVERKKQEEARKAREAEHVKQQKQKQLEIEQEREKQRKLRIQKRAAEEKRLSDEKRAKRAKVSRDTTQIAPKPVLPFAPSTHQQRVSFLKLLIKEIRVRVPECKVPNSRAIELEYEIAKSSTKATYVNSFKNFVIKLKQKDSSTLAKVLKREDSQKGKKSQLPLHKLQELCHPEKLLKENNYVMAAPEAPAEKSSKSETSLVPCARCHTLFDTKGKFKGICKYHPGKKVYQGSGTHIWSCCQAEITRSLREDYGNSDLILGCVTGDFHVFKINDAFKLHQVLPYKDTKTLSNANVHKSDKYKAVVGLDAEMVYTTLGFELARVTVVDFCSTLDNVTVLYDKLVQPKGKVVDYNSQFSGIHHIDAENSVTYETFLQELFEFIDQDTILVGHGLENDLNVMRLIHGKIIDTAILFDDKGQLCTSSSAKSVYRKIALRKLAELKLKKQIQSGEHDSAEDAVTCVEIINSLNIL